MSLINASAGDLGPVFNAIADKAMHFCDPGFGGLWAVDGDMARARATRNLPEAYSEFLTRQPPLDWAGLLSPCGLPCCKAPQET